MSRTVTESIEQTGRPMRWESAEALARRFSRDVLRIWSDWQEGILSIMRQVAADTNLAEGEVPSLASLRQRKTFTLAPVTRPGCEVTTKRDPTADEVMSAVIVLTGLIGAAAVDAITDLTAEVRARIFSAPGTGGGGAFNQYYPLVAQDAWERAYEFADRNARATGYLDQLQGRSPKGKPFPIQSPTYQGWLQNGYNLVTSKLSIAARGEVFAAMTQGFREGWTWSEIAAVTHRRVGAGYLYHWERLIRTEMVAGHYYSMTARYRNAGVSYVEWVLSLGACPICSDQKGFYTLGAEPPIPSSTHPNCRCMYIPFFELPNGATLRR